MGVDKTISIHNREFYLVILLFFFPKAQKQDITKKIVKAREGLPMEEPPNPTTTTTPTPYCNIDIGNTCMNSLSLLY